MWVLFLCFGQKHQQALHYRIIRCKSPFITPSVKKYRQFHLKLSLAYDFTNAKFGAYRNSDMRSYVQVGFFKKFCTKLSFMSFLIILRHIMFPCLHIMWFILAHFEEQHKQNFHLLTFKRPPEHEFTCTKFLSIRFRMQFVNMIDFDLIKFYYDHFQLWS